MNVLASALLISFLLLQGLFPHLAQAQSPPPPSVAVATFAGGCFWCMEPPFDKLAGVQATTSGYMGGSVINPTYQQVSAGNTGHFEVVQVSYDPTQVSYDTLLETFWQNIDPLDDEGQFCDKGSQYRSAIFVADSQQEQAAVASKEKLMQSGQFQQPIATEILPASTFYPAEDYHQDYYLNHPNRYKFYRFGCGRDQRLTQLWGEN